MDCSGSGGTRYARLVVLPITNTLSFDWTLPIFPIFELLAHHTDLTQRDSQYSMHRCFLTTLQPTHRHPSLFGTRVEHPVQLETYRADAVWGANGVAGAEA